MARWQSGNCYTPECGYDLADCENMCSDGCPQSLLGDGNCDWKWNTLECNLDNGDCGFCYNPNGDNTCDIDKLLNDTCDPEWMSEHCSFDNDGCGDVYCNSDRTCLTSTIDNNFWDLGCVEHSECNFDG